MSSRPDELRGRGRTPLALLAAALLALFVPAWSLTAAAQTPTGEEEKSGGNDPETLQRAREHFDRGVQLYRQGQFDAALGEFERSYRLRPSPRLHYNIAQSQRALKRHALAHERFRRYLRENADLPAQRVARVRKILTELEKNLAEVKLRGLPPDARVRVDGTPVTAPDGTLWLEPGSHAIQVSAPEHTPARQKIVVAAGQKRELALVLARSTPPPGASPGVATGTPSPGGEPQGEPVLRGTDLLPPPGGTASGSPGAASAPIVTSGSAATRDDRPTGTTPIYRRWWFWAGVAAVVVGGVAAGAAVGAQSTPSGTLSPGVHQFR